MFQALREAKRVEEERRKQEALEEERKRLREIAAQREAAEQAEAAAAAAAAAATSSERRDSFAGLADLDEAEVENEMARLSQLAGKLNPKLHQPTNQQNTVGRV